MAEMYVCMNAQATFKFVATQVIKCDSYTHKGLSWSIFNFHKNSIGQTSKMCVGNFEIILRKVISVAISYDSLL